MAPDGRTLSSVVSVASGLSKLGSAIACAIVGSDRSLYCWPRSGTSTRIKGVDRGFVTGVISISGKYAIAGDDNYSAYNWGNLNGFASRVTKTPAVIDNPDTIEDETAPVEYATGVSHLSGDGWGHVCALEEGTAYCWAGGSDGQLGHGCTEGREVTYPREVVAPGVRIC